jgi:histidyl-tRNA synthetase
LVHVSTQNWKNNILFSVFQAGSLAKKGLHELEAILSNAEHLGVKVPSILTLGLVYNTHHFSGMVFQVMMEVPKKKGKRVLDILAAGGRYDGLVRNQLISEKPSWWIFLYCCLQSQVIAEITLGPAWIS